MRGTRYSPLDQINAANFNKLEVAWRFKTDNLGPRPEYKLEGTPLDGQGRALRDRPARAASVVALDAQDRRADLGAQPARRQARGASRRASCRAAACRTGPTAAATSASSTSRPAIGWSRSTRRPARRSPSFGKDGIVDLKVGVVYGNGQPIDLETGEIGLHSTPTVVKDVVIVGSSFTRRRDRRRRTTTPRGSSARSTCGPASCCGRSTRFRGPASSATTRGRTTRGRSTATPACGRRSPSTRSSASSTCRSRRRPSTTTAAIVRATTCSPRASSASI